MFGPHKSCLVSVEIVLLASQTEFCASLGEIRLTIATVFSSLDLCRANTDNIFLDARSALDRTGRHARETIACVACLRNNIRKELPSIIYSSVPTIASHVEFGCVASIKKRQAREDNSYRNMQCRCVAKIAVSPQQQRWLLGVQAR